MTAFPQIRKSALDVLGMDGVVPVSCMIYGGMLTPALTAVKASQTVPPAGIICAGYSKAAGKYLLAAGNGVYETLTGIKYVNLSAKQSARAFYYEENYNGENCAVVVRDDLAVIYGKDGFLSAPLDYKLSCGAYHCGRIFAADAEDGFTLRWTGQNGITDWTEGVYGGGWTSLDPSGGVILDVLGYGGKLVLVRKSALTVFSAYGMPENFATLLTDTATEDIVAGSAQVAGGKLLFCAGDGLFAYDGNSIKRVVHRLDGRISDPVCSVSYGNSYFLGCKYGDKDVVMCYDTDLNESYLIDVKASAMCVNGGVCVFNDEGLFKLENGENWSLEVLGASFKTGGKTTLVGVYAGVNSEIYIKSGTAERTFTNATKTVRPRMRGTEFYMTVKGSGVRDSITVTGETEYGI